MNHKHDPSGKQRKAQDLTADLMAAEESSPAEHELPDDLLTQLSDELAESTPACVKKDIKSSPTKTYRREDLEELTN